MHFYKGMVWMSNLVKGFDRLELSTVKFFPHGLAASLILTLSLYNNTKWQNQPISAKVKGAPQRLQVNMTVEEVKSKYEVEIKNFFQAQITPRAYFVWHVINTSGKLN